MLFECFATCHNDSTSEALANARNGKSHPLHKVIKQSLKFLKDEVLSEINMDPESAGIDRRITASEIKWSVTISTGKTSASMTMMRKAAFDAGMLSHESSNKLVLFLEPIAAIFACEATRFVEHERGAAAAGSHEILQVGDTCMVLDCGGCNVRTTVHRVEETSPLRLTRIGDPNGGPWGSTHVDQEGFEEFLKKLVGTECWSRVKPSWTGANVMQSWEQAKLNLKHADLRDDTVMPVRITLSGVGDDEHSWALKDTLALEGTILKECVDKYNRDEGGQVRLCQRGIDLLMPLLQMQIFIKKKIDKILNHVKDVIKEPGVNLKHIYLVGGFAENTMLQTSVKVELGSESCSVIVPSITMPGPQLMVVNGAVLLGLQPGPGCESLTLKLRDQQGFIDEIRIDHNTKFEKFFEAYCARHNLKRDQIRFLHDGNRLQDKHTPGEIEMEDNEVIDVFLFMIGG